MKIHSDQEALYLACEMEAFAVQLYERALLVMVQQNRKDEPLYACLLRMLDEEKSHYKQFRTFYTGIAATREQEMMLSAVAEGILFEGGLMGAIRKGLLVDVSHMLTLAQRAEQTSVEKYREFAALTADEKAKDTLLCIAAQEEAHLVDLQTLSSNHKDRNDM